MLGDLADRAAEATAVLTRRRMDARVAAVRAIRMLEDRLVSIFSAARCRGMPSLLHREDGEFFGLRVTAWSEDRRATLKLPRDGREVVVLTAHGVLAVASFDPDAGGLATRIARDDELTLEDVSNFVRVAREALEGHIAAVDRRVVAIDRAQALSSSLAKLLKEADAG